MRYLPITEADRSGMLQAIGAPSVEALFSDVPEDALLAEPVDLPLHASEFEVEQRLSRIAGRNRAAGAGPFFCGAGSYRHHIPASVDYLIQRGEFLTSYTPYQPEIAQGTLQYLFEFQIRQVCLLTGMEVANASMYDGATAAAEAVTMANRVTRRSKAVVSGNLHPHYRDTAATLARFQGFTLEAGPPMPAGGEDLASHIDEDTSCVVVQYPGPVRQYRGPLGAGGSRPREGRAAGGRRHRNRGARRAQAARGDGGRYRGGRRPVHRQCDEFRRPASGPVRGPRAPYAPDAGPALRRDRRCRRAARLCADPGDARASISAANARPATSAPIPCLCSLAFTIHLTLLGETGLRRLAALNHAGAVSLADRLAERVVTPHFFNEFTVRLDGDAAAAVERLAGEGILAGVPVSRLHPGAGLDDLLLVAVTETVGAADRDALAEALR